jgi:hypothetical protein
MRRGQQPQHRTPVPRPIEVTTVSPPQVRSQEDITPLNDGTQFDVGDEDTPLPPNTATAGDAGNEDTLALPRAGNDDTPGDRT